MPRESFERVTAAHDALLGSVLRQFPTVELFDAPSYLCDGELCWAMLEGMLLYRDRDHLSTDGSRYLGQKFGLGLLTGASLRRWADEATQRATAAGERLERRRINGLAAATPPPQPEPARPGGG